MRPFSSTLSTVRRRRRCRDHGHQPPRREPAPVRCPAQWSPGGGSRPPPATALPATWHQRRIVKGGWAQCTGAASTPGPVRFHRDPTPLEVKRGIRSPRGLPDLVFRSGLPLRCGGRLRNDRHASGEPRSYVGSVDLQEGDDRRMTAEYLGPEADVVPAAYP